jgi:hypothetical protein
MRAFVPALLALAASACTARETPAPAPAAPAVTAETTAAVAPATEAEDGSDAPTDTFVDGVYTSHYFNLRFRLPVGFDLVDTSQAGRQERPPREGRMIPNPPTYFLDADGMRMPIQLGGSGPLGVQQSYDSLTFVGPPESGIYMVVANSDSAQLGAGTFENLDERTTFTNVRFAAENSRARTISGLPAYQGEGDAQMAGDAVPVAFMALGIATEGAPVSVTLFVAFDVYAACYAGAPEGGVPDIDAGTAPQPVGCPPPGYNSDVMRAVLDSVEVVDVRRTRTR